MAGPDLDSKNESKRRRRSSWMPMSDGFSPRKRRMARSTRALRCSPLMSWWQSSQAAQELMDSKVTGCGGAPSKLRRTRFSDQAGESKILTGVLLRWGRGGTKVADEARHRESLGRRVQHLSCLVRNVWDGSGGWSYSVRSCWQRRDPLGWR